MKTVFTPEEIMTHRGCYERGQVRALSFISKPQISLIDILESEISIKDKRWFLFNKGEMTVDQKRQLCLQLVWVVLPIYETKYPGDNRVRACLEGTEKYLRGEITLGEFQELRRAADADADAADAAYAYADAAYADAAYADAAYAAAAAYAYAAAADADANADAYADKTTYSQRLQQAMIDFVLAQ